MDVKSDFLNGFMNEEVYVHQPLEFINKEKSNHVFKLTKCLHSHVIKKFQEFGMRD